MIAVSTIVTALVLLALFESSSAVEFTDDVIRGGFHVKDKWPLCDSVFSRIRDQGECNSCWALAPADVLRDRLCIQQLYDHSSDDAKQKAQDQFKRNHESHRSAFPNISVTDILSCARFSLKRTACTIGGRPQMAWHHFETAGFLDEDPATSTSEFSYYFSRCDHTIPSTKVWQDARRQLSERETSEASMSKINGRCATVYFPGSAIKENATLVGPLHQQMSCVTVCVFNSCMITAATTQNKKRKMNSNEITNLIAQRFLIFQVTDILSCARFSLKRTACTIGGRPQMAWHHFETAGFLNEDPATSTSEFSYYFSQCDHTIPSTKVWQHARRQFSERETSAMRSVDSGLPYCHRRSLEPLECPPEIGNRRRQKVLASSASTTGVERIGGNTGIMGSNLDERIMRDILENGPVQASMGMLPALATIPFGPLTKPDEGPHSGGTDESWYPYVYRCVNSVWLRNLQSNPTAPENQRQNHAVRVVGWGSVPFHSDAYHKLFDVSNTSSSTIASAPTEGPRRNSSPINKLNRPRKAIASLRASSISAAQQARQFDDIGAPDSTSSQDEHATLSLLQLNRFRFKATDIAIPAASDNDKKRDDQHVDGAREALWVDYWIVANSWGPYWGDKGFFYVQRGDNDCRLSHNAMSPNLASP
ncbi:peptidase, putative [Bodo saltans]|uniref:Peptidase, putative n=1 Tax=Bodo saltans TaxID=75058 RepID=A0A0S4IYH8_BODSA|nr:peptidase, putative [Bodo saltans]|eukprot:CUG06247.1 peptidase, putative [Bodo saltans]